MTNKELIEDLNKWIDGKITLSEKFLKESRGNPDFIKGQIAGLSLARFGIPLTELDYLKPKVLIDIKGGNIQFVGASVNTNVLIVDHDNMKTGDLKMQWYDNDSIMTDDEMEEYFNKKKSKYDRERQKFN